MDLQSVSGKSFATMAKGFLEKIAAFDQRRNIFQILSEAWAETRLWNNINRKLVDIGSQICHNISVMLHKEVVPTNRQTAGYEKSEEWSNETILRFIS